MVLSKHEWIIVMWDMGNIRNTVYAETIYNVESINGGATRSQHGIYCVTYLQINLMRQLVIIFQCLESLFVAPQTQMPDLSVGDHFAKSLSQTEPRPQNRRNSYTTRQSVPPRLFQWCFNRAAFKGQRCCRLVSEQSPYLFHQTIKFRRLGPYIS